MKAFADLYAALDETNKSGSRTRLLDDTNLGTYFFDSRQPLMNPLMK